jgi:hypothetical protein
LGAGLGRDRKDDQEQSHSQEGLFCRLQNAQGFFVAFGLALDVVVHCIRSSQPIAMQFISAEFADASQLAQKVRGVWRLFGNPPDRNEVSDLLCRGQNGP